MNKREERIREKGESRIDELFGGIYEMETMNLENGSELLEDELSEEEKGRIFKMIQEKMGTHEIQGDHERIETKIKEEISREEFRRKGKKRRILIAALVAVFAFATTAFAAELFQWDTRISNYLGIDEQNRADLSGGGMNVGISDENAGVTVEAVQTIGDGNNMYIILDVTAPENKIIYPNSRFDMLYLRVEGSTSLGYSCDMLPDDDENDNKATFLFTMEANRKINNKIINLEFKDLGHYTAESADVISDFAGDWELEWKLDYEDISTNYQLGKELIIDGETVTVDSATISPLAVNIQISGSYFTNADEEPREPGSGDLVELKAITLKDGTVLTQDDAASWGCSSRGEEYIMNIQMKELLEVEQIKSITLNETEFQL